MAQSLSGNSQLSPEAELLYKEELRRMEAERQTAQDAIEVEAGRQTAQDVRKREAELRAGQDAIETVGNRPFNPNPNERWPTDTYATTATEAWNAQQRPPTSGTNSPVDQLAPFPGAPQPAPGAPEPFNRGPLGDRGGPVLPTPDRSTPLGQHPPGQVVATPAPSRMSGLLDFIKTPEGQGLLSTVFGGLAGARRGEPLNSLGRAGMAGIAGYGGALDRNAQMAQLMQKNTLISHIDPSKVTPKSLAKFSVTRNYGDLELLTDAPGQDKPQLVDRWNPKTNQIEKVWINPGSPDGVVAGLGVPLKEENLDPKIKQYEYALKGGYKGSFTDFIAITPTIMAGAIAPLRDAQVKNIQDENAYNLPPPRSPTPADKLKNPMPGQVMGGYKFKGGNPADKSNWEKQ